MSGRPPLQAVTGLAAPLMRDHIDTDILIPSREITSPTREGYGPKLFAPWRYREPGGPENPDFILNRAPWRQAQILLTGHNFGCGSSREMAVWALLQFGIRCVVAPSFGAIFRSNCIRNGLLPVELPPEQVQALAAQAAQQPLWLTVDLQRQRLCVLGPGQQQAAPGTTPDTTPNTEAPAADGLPFPFDADDRDLLLSGQDAIDRAWQHRTAIEAFEQRDRLLRPWAWPSPRADQPTE